MRVLLDHNIPHELRRLFPKDHDVYTAQFLGWEDYEDDELLNAAMDNNFAVLVTMDTSLPSQRNVDSFSLGVVVLDVHPATPDVLTSRMDRLVEACSRAGSAREVVTLN